MLKYIRILPLLFAIAACSDEPSPAEPVPPSKPPVQTHHTFTEYRFVIDKIDPAVVLAGLNIGKPGHDKSNDGLPRTRWEVKGTPAKELEAIGKHPKDVDVLSGQCIEYNADGNSIGWPENGGCANMFKGLLTNIVDKPDAAFADMVKHARLQPHIKVEVAQAVIEDPNLSLTLDHDGFFFLRKKKR